MLFTGMSACSRSSFTLQITSCAISKSAGASLRLSA
jgi:hypothetical protein